MDDERLLSEALRAHAAGGVSSPGTPNATPPGPAEDGSSGSASRLRDRFRPLGRKRGETAEAAPATVAHPTSAAQPPAQPTPPPAGPYPTPARGAPPMPRPAPRPGAHERPWQQGARLPGAGRPVPPLPTGPVTRPPGPGVPHPRPAPTGAGPAVPPSPDADDPAPWTPARIAWWSGVALLGGAIAGALAAVGTLGLPG